jgi:hypothetical protein
MAAGTTVTDIGSEIAGYLTADITLVAALVVAAAAVAVAVAVVAVMVTGDCHL